MSAGPRQRIQNGAGLPDAYEVHRPEGRCARHGGGKAPSRGTIDRDTDGRGGFGVGVTKRVVMSLVFNGVNPGMGRGEVAGFEASVVLSRKDFGVGAELPLDSGGSMVGDKVTITLALDALKQA
jgi:YceI-like domain